MTATRDRQAPSGPFAAHGARHAATVWNVSHLPEPILAAALRGRGRRGGCRPLRLHGIQADRFSPFPSVLLLCRPLLVSSPRYCCKMKTWTAGITCAALAALAEGTDTAASYPELDPRLIRSSETTLPFSRPGSTASPRPRIPRQRPEWLPAHRQQLPLE